jgi:hypothetical protein
MDNLPFIINIFKYGFSIVLCLTGIVMFAISLHEKESWREFIFSWPAGMSFLLLVTSLIFYFFTTADNILIQMKTITTAFTVLYAIYASKHKLFKEDKETGKKYFTKIGYVGVVFICIISISSVSADFLKNEMNRQIRKAAAEEEMKQKRKIEIRISRVLKNVDLTKDEAKQLNEQINNFIENISKKIAQKETMYNEIKQEYDIQTEKVKLLQTTLETAVTDRDKYRTGLETSQLEIRDISVKLGDEKKKYEVTKTLLDSEKEKFALINKEFQEEKSNLQKLREDLETAQNALISQRDQFNKSISELNRIIGILNTKIITHSENISEVYTGLKAFESSLKSNQKKSLSNFNSYLKELSAITRQLAAEKSKVTE